MSDDKPGRRGPAGGRDSTGRGGDSRAGGGRGGSSYPGRDRREGGDRGEAPRSGRGGSSGAPGERRRSDERPRDDRPSRMTGLGMTGLGMTGVARDSPRSGTEAAATAGPVARAPLGMRGDRAGTEVLDVRAPLGMRGDRAGTEVLVARAVLVARSAVARAGARTGPRAPSTTASVAAGRGWLPSPRVCPSPAIAEGVTGKELDRSVHQQLRTLSKENAEGVAQHLVMVAALLEADDFERRRGPRRDRGAAGRPGACRTRGAWAGGLPQGRVGPGAQRVPHRAPPERLVAHAARSWSTASEDWAAPSARSTWRPRRRRAVSPSRTASSWRSSSPASAATWGRRMRPCSRCRSPS